MTHEYFWSRAYIYVRIVVRRASTVETLSSERPGHHVFKSESRPGDAFICAREPGNPHSPDAIVVKLGDYG